MKRRYKSVEPAIGMTRNIASSKIPAEKASANGWYHGKYIATTFGSDSEDEGNHHPKCSAVL